jgi:DNA-binding transcriptional MerR regulator
MASKQRKPKGLKISELARIAGVPVPTIKHYLNEGLLPRPLKTGRTMSYYDEGCVERVRLIKRLKTECFFPLSVIKRILEGGAQADGELALSDALINVPPLSPGANVVPRNRLAKRTGYSLAKVDRMEALGLIHPQSTSRGKVYDPIDCRIIALVRQREEAGLPFDYSLEMMSVYRRHIESIVKDDAKLFVQRMLGNTSASDAAKYIREGDKALGAFMPLIKAKLARANAEKILAEVDSTFAKLKEAFRFRYSSSDGARAKIHHSDSCHSLMHVAVRTLRGEKHSASPSRGAHPDILYLASGLRDLARGRMEDALIHLRRISDSERMKPLASALIGLGHLGKMPAVPGFLPGMHLITDALAHLDTPRRHMESSEVSLLTSYFKGVGLAIVPEVFDTHRRAAANLSLVMRADGLPERCPQCGAEWKEFASDIRLKASYFLAQLYLEDEQYSSAKDVLTNIKDVAGTRFYGRWASKQLAAHKQHMRQE